VALPWLGPPVFATDMSDERESERLVIAIDGPAGAGKSTVARGLARALGLRFLDTGAMYRAVTLLASEAGIDPGAGPELGALAARSKLDFDNEGRIHVGARVLEPEIRSEGVTAAVSEVSAQPEVRMEIVARQQELGELWDGLVAEGRDTTTVVFPRARFRFYLDASPRERARRRALELGIPEQADRIQTEIEARDAYDSGREHSPLRLGEDVVHVDTDGRTPEEVVAHLLALVETGKR